MKGHKVAGDLSDILAALAAGCLNVPTGDLERNVPLTRYGLDSIATIELTAAIERTLDRRLSDTVLLEHPDLDSLERYLTSADAGVAVFQGGMEQMVSDSVLSPDIRPVAPPMRGSAGGGVLLTGATGFLGGFILRSLLQKMHVKVHCLARPAGGRSARDRIRTSMLGWGIWKADFDSRIEVVEGDIASPLLGLERKRYEALSDETDAVYHAAANVNWVYSYGALRNTNVSGTRELLRFACTARTKLFHFISSVSVCYSTAGPREVSEDDDVHPFLQGIHLGYAQSKCVAEALVCQAGERGVPVAIFRPSLVTGDRSSGAVKTDDLLSRLVKATILMGTAPDLDWNMDCCPVDYVADAIVSLASSGERKRIFHLVNPVQRHWREFVLWLNLYGYEVKIVPFREWLELLVLESRATDHPRRELLPFFSNEPAGEGGLTLPELYEESRRSRVNGDQTLRALQGYSLGSPRLGASLLDRYFQSYVDSGFLPEASNGWRTRKGRAQTVSDEDLLSDIFRGILGRDKVKVLEVKMEPLNSEHSIISELASWKYGNAAGLDRCRVMFSKNGGAPEALTVIVKKKARDEHAIDVAIQVAGQCSPAMGRAFARHGWEIGLAGSHVREIGIYLQRNKSFRRHMPAVLGSRCDDERGEWILVLEDISSLDMIDSAHSIETWSEVRIESALRGLASLHSVWFGREEKLMGQPWLGPVVSGKKRAQMGDLWSALAENACRRFSEWAGPDMRELQRRLVEEVDSRWQRLDEMTRTLTHNDFNSRNIALRREGKEMRLCAYDWELATVGVPQHDLAEFLCFVLAPGADRREVFHYLEFHRAELEREARVKIDPNEWVEGFGLSLHDLLVDRFGMYAMIDCFRPQRFMRRVVSTWRNLYGLFPLEEVLRK